MHRTIRLLIGALVAALVLAACGEDGGATRTGPDGEEFNDADVALATDMIPHHAQALVMVDMTDGRDLDPELQQLTDDIRAAQVPEIELMADWLTAWREPIPETMRDHANSHGGHGAMEDMGSMPGMMSAEDMEALERAQGEAFRTRWLEMMIEHHRGAIEMAEDHQAAGVYPPALDLSARIAAEQEREIATMEALLAP